MTALTTDSSAPHRSTPRPSTQVYGPTVDPATGLEGYTSALEDSGAPLLGHMVVYSVCETKVDPHDLELWFTQLGLDLTFLPSPVRPSGAFERVTGSSEGIRISYPLHDPTATSTAYSRAGRDRAGREATLMIRPVHRDDQHIVRHLVREVRDGDRGRLSYDDGLAEITFHRDSSPGAARSAGTMRIHPNLALIQTLPEPEQATIHKMLGQVSREFRLRCAFLVGDQLRTMLRSYTEHLGAIKIRRTGGVYFVDRTHTPTLAALRELVGRFGEGSKFTRVPILDQAEMRELIIDEFTRQAKDNLDQLAADIATAQASGATDKKIQTFYQRFRNLKDATAQHAQLLSTSLTDADAALKLVETQLGGLLSV